MQLEHFFSWLWWVEVVYILSSGSVYNKRHTLSHQNWKLILQQISIYYLLEIRTVLNGANTQTNKNKYYSLQTARSLITWMCGCVHIYRCIYMRERERGGERDIYGMMGICKSLLPGLQKRLKRMGDTWNWSWKTCIWDVDKGMLGRDQNVQKHGDIK